MSNLIPYDPKEYYTLKMLRTSVRHLHVRNKQNGQYAEALRHEKKNYYKALDSYRSGTPISFH